MPPANTIEDFWRKVDKRGPDECWLWLGRMDSRERYGYFGYQGTQQATHRLAWVFTHGPINNGLHVLHKCDVTKCANPAHLFLGTHADNMSDMKVKGRQRTGPRTVRWRDSLKRGSEHGNAKLTEAQVKEIRCLAAQGVSFRKLAKQFNMDRSVISDIVNRRAWKHV